MSNALAHIIPAPIQTGRSLDECERVIERGLASFIEVGQTLAEISERRLYREQGFATFEQYCAERWGWSRKTAYNYIAASEVAENVPTSGHLSASQAIELAPLPPEQQREIAQSIDFSKATVREVREAVREVRDRDFEEDDSQRKHVRGTFGTGENEWYTPQAYIEHARNVLGVIDLDPASSAEANQAVRARMFYCRQDDGLSKPWMGTVWINPPYAQPYIAQFAQKLIDELASGRTEAAIALTHNYTDTAWFQSLARAADAVCFTRGRVKFWSPYGEIAAPTQGQAFFYFGANPHGFSSEFADVGVVFSRVQPT